MCTCGSAWVFSVRSEASTSVVAKQPLGRSWAANVCRFLMGLSFFCAATNVLQFLHYTRFMPFHEYRSMAISLDAALGPHAQALALRAQRMGVLANNIAHADTPGFQARDIDFNSALQARLHNAGARMRQTHAKHLPIPTGSGAAQGLKYRLPLMPSADSNTVDVQVEQAQLAENNLQFQAAYRFLNGRITGLMTAIRGE